MGRYFGTQKHVVEAVQRLEDIEVLKSYLLLPWSEWDTFDSFHEICASVDKDFGGIGMGHHRVDLIQRLDQVLNQLDQGFEYLVQQNPQFKEDSFQSMKYQYKRLREALLETHIKAITHVSDPNIAPLCMLTQAKIHRVPYNVYVCPSAPMSLVSWLEYLALMAKAFVCLYFHFTITCPAHYIHYLPAVLHVF